MIQSLHSKQMNWTKDVYKYAILMIIIGEADWLIV